ncbi:16S rRNA (cytidine(1402)-2'-O)-methyltransferase [Heyndrickxia coagulans]|uniref:16S rRNA (cytidine(1402)-2'-O)-methyltransferase n=1 Tax=Heyndrickxia coagulans TaxID=1398 RepID=UPI002E24112A|nr:16S rRNA (cytidine(1402)-2'-O)-methyltransferase [Heyndrickxia coagulans]MED4935955.1 16S rRNA (cytidine(1402)-2'-O)-methyltransferase [Heyndrickxia coagulans]
MSTLHRQQSFHDEKNKGILYLVPTPIGNLEDMTFRAVRILKEADLIAAEDTRNSKKLCSYFDIHTPLVSHHEHNKEASVRDLITRLARGEKIALVSDAGMPCISDPGYELAAACIREGIPVVPLPGANAALTALIAAGIAPQPFTFYGFLPREKQEKRAALERLAKIPSTFILYEAPHRLKHTLQMMVEVLGDRKISISRELTKKFEEFLRGTIREAVEWAENNEVRGEFCLVVEGSPETGEEDGNFWWTALSVKEHVEAYMQQKQLPTKEAIKLAAKDRKLPKREVYQIYHEL